MKNNWISTNNSELPPIESEGNGVKVSEDILVTDGENVGIGYCVINVHTSLEREYFCEGLSNITHWQKIELPCPGSKI